MDKQKKTPKKKTSKKNSSIDLVGALIKKAETGDTKALAELQEMTPEQLDKHALLVHGDLARITEHMLIEKSTNNNLVFTEGVKGQVKRLKEELEGSSPSPLERLLIERVVCCWIMINYADTIHALMETGRAWKADEYFQKLQDRAQKRFLQACKALAQVRKLLGPNVQINMAEKQINVMGQTGAG